MGAFLIICGLILFGMIGYFIYRDRRYLKEQKDIHHLDHLRRMNDKNGH